MADKSDKETSHGTRLYFVYRFGVFLFWAAILTVCIINRDYFTVEGILRISPQNQFAAFWIFMALFALKSISIVMYSGVLYAAAGLLFPMPLALLTSVCGSMVMFTIPYFAGRIFGTRAVNAITARYKKAALLRSLLGQNEFLSAAAIRLIGIIPYDAASLFLGASGMKYIPYLCGSLCGYLPFMLILSFVGSNAHEPGSAGFLISAACAALEFIASVAACAILWKRLKNSSE